MKNVLTLALLVLPACSATTEPAIRRLAYIYDGREGQTLIVAPDSVRVNQPFAATVYAIGSGSVYCNQPDGVSISNEGDVVRVAAYMRHPPRKAPLVCPSDAHRYPYAVTSMFTSVGLRKLRLVGSSTEYGDPLKPDSVERTIIVVP